MILQKRSNPNRNDDIYRVKSLSLRLFLLFLASIGDAVIYCSVHIFFFARKGLSKLPIFWRRESTYFRAFLASIILFGKIKSQRFFFEIRLLTTQVHIQIHALVQTLTHTVLPLPRYVFLRRKKAQAKKQMIPSQLKRSTLPHPGRAVFGFTLGVVLTLFFVFVPYNIYIFIKFLPNPHLLSQRIIPVTTQIFDRNGILLYEIHGDEDRKPITLQELPSFVQQATIAIEDKDFRRHAGFSIAGIVRAARETFFHNNTQGGSTITQQLVKSSLLTPEITITRKLREIALAFWAERIYTKDQILEMYLNQVPFGGTTWGIEAASERYFGKKSHDLNLAEAAYLVGLPAAPSLYSPYGARPELAKVRQHEVLRRMVEDGYISQEQANIALALPLGIKPYIVDIKAPHFVMYVKDLLTQKYGARTVDLGGLRVKTTLDSSLQEKAQQIVTKNISGLEKLRVGNGAVLITDPKNGEILSMVGSKDYFAKDKDGNVNVALTWQQPGSSIKVVTYAAALENGFTAASTIEDSPVSYPLPNQPSYTPVNYDGKFHGNVTLRTALANSYNVPAVKVLNKIGVKTMIGMGKRMGITTWDDESRFGLSLTLGAGEVPMMDMAVVYGVLANGGSRVDLDPFIEVKDYTGRIFYSRPTPVPQPVLLPEIAFILSDILADNNARSAAFGPNSTLNIPGKTVSVKTGTSNDKRDNWTIGYTPSYVVTVWVGNNDNSPMDPQLTSGITGAAPIWNQVMTELLKNKPNEAMSPQSNIVKLPCNGRDEYFVRGTEPKNGCPRFPASSPNIQQAQARN